MAGFPRGDAAERPGEREVVHLGPLGHQLQGGGRTPEQAEPQLRTSSLVWSQGTHRAGQALRMPRPGRRAKCQKVRETASPAGVGRGTTRAPRAGTGIGLVPGTEPVEKFLRNW
jgi:hypothetical protein